MPIMTTVKNKMIDTLRHEGIVPFIRKARSFIKYKIIFYKSKILNGHKIKFNSESADVYFSNFEEALAVRYISNEEGAFIRDFLNELNSNDTVWDVGANIGVHSCIFGGKARKVISIEPYPPNIQSLYKNIKRNNINAEIFSVALSNRNGTEVLSVPETENPGDQWPALVPDSISESRQNELKNDNVLEVTVKKGDTLVENGVSPPDIVKVDVEGGSHKVIQGLEKTLKRKECRAIYVEVHLPNPGKRRPSVEDFGKKPKDVQNTLENYGFKTDVILEREADFFVKGLK